MKIEKFHLSDKFIGQQFEFIQRKTMLRPLRFRTEQAIKVAMIGYFKVASGYHLLADKKQVGLIKKRKGLKLSPFFFSDPLGARTQDPNIKSVVLYLLS